MASTVTAFMLVAHVVLARVMLAHALKVYAVMAFALLTGVAQCLAALEIPKQLWPSHC